MRMFLGVNATAAESPGFRTDGVPVPSIGWTLAYPRLLFRMFAARRVVVSA